MELLERAGELGALGATISGAGPTVLFWCQWQHTGAVMERAQAAAPEAEVRRVTFAAARRGRARAVSTGVEAAGGVVARSGGPGAARAPARAMTTGRCPRASSTPANRSRRPRCARWRRRPALRARLVRELPAIRYTDAKGRPKLVRYWLMEVEHDPGFEPNDEVDELRWLDPREALSLLTYERDGEVLCAV